MKYTYTSYYLDCPIVNGRVFDVFEPEEYTKDTALFIVHGGGWRAGSREGYHELMEAFANRGYIVASTDYRLYARDAFEQLSDIRAAYDRFVTLLKEKNRPLKIVVHGASAGAHLASLLICAGPGECGEENNLVNEWVKPVKGALQATPCDFYPWEEMMPQNWAMLQNIAGVPYEKDSQVYKRLSLTTYINKENPPIFFMEAELENAFLSEHTLKIQKQHREWGIMSEWKVYHRMEHGFFFALKRKGQIEAFEDMCKWMDGDGIGG